jgi:drug/metabolite transporter (DMT)-like permease
LLALVAKFALHEQVSPLRWLGIALISGGVSFVAGGPALTSHHEEPAKDILEDSPKPGVSSANAAHAASSGVKR